MLVDTMAGSDNNIWQWCNARKKICRQGSAAAFNPPKGSTSCRMAPLKHPEQVERYDSFSSHEDHLSSADSINESKVLDGHCCMVDPVEQPTTPDLGDDLDPLENKPRKHEQLDLHCIAIAIAASPCSSSSSAVCGQTSADSSSSAMHDHDDFADGGIMHLQSMDLGSSPTCNHKDLSPKSERRELGLQPNDLTEDRMPSRGIVRNLRPLASRRRGKARIIPSQGLDLLVKAICLLENSCVLWGNKDQLKGRMLPFIDTGLQKRRVIRRAKNAYKHTCKIQEAPEQSQNQKIPMVVELDANPDLHGNHLPQQNEVDEDQLASSQFLPKLRRSVRSYRSNQATSFAYAAETGIRI